MIFKRKKTEAELSRREIIAKRRLAVNQAPSGAGESGRARQFQKNRTLVSRTGEPSGSERQAWRNLRQKRRRLIVTLVGVLAGAGMLMLALMQFAGKVQVQTPTPMKEESTSVYVAILNEYFAERPMERFRGLVQEDALQDFFSVKAPEVKTVSITSGTELATATLRLTFREPVAQWSSSDRTYFVDDMGVTFERNFFAPPSVVVKDESNIQAEAGVEVINQRSLGFLGYVVSGFREHGMTVQEVTLPENTLRTMVVHLEGRATTVQMTIDRDAKAQVEEAVQALQYLDGKGEAPGYIIVSVDQQVFYK
ncbi:hypothetical protein EOM33_03450 [Candidatus Saccharibacteria bacterium]|nr:hypothetical protein [Candidatus Saccharibacteria bacterium]